MDEKYNSNYLRAEYNFVQNSAQMATKWELYEQDGDRYNLQYRTAGDNRVRPEHQALDGITLPITDPFWDSYYPPNGWNCRCTVAQVRKSKYPVTPRDEAMQRGQQALTKDKKGIFRFNPGKQKKAVPDYNPYTISRCNDCDIPKKGLKLAFVPDFQLCRACENIRDCYKNREKANSTSLKKYTVPEKKEIYAKPISEQLEEIGLNIFKHVLKDNNAMDYKRVFDAAKLYADEFGENVIIMPEIHVSEKEIRKKMGIPTGKKNPDILINDYCIDVKSPFSHKNIVSNAVDACKQGAIACITDHHTVLHENKLGDLAYKVFCDKNYTQNYIDFIVNGKMFHFIRNTFRFN
ncbi:MAG: minor capsid protein [Bacteroidaceae bacterium]|nr:minor capsid protein [Bacteroidaceae bacterium]